VTVLISLSFVKFFISIFRGSRNWWPLPRDSCTYWGRYAFKCPLKIDIV